MRRIRRFVIIVLLLGLAAGGFSFMRYHQTSTTAETKTVLIPPGTGVRALVAQLHAEGLTPAFPTIALPLLLSADYKSLKAGEYEFSTAMAPADIIRKIARGEVVIHKITIPEGWNSYQLRAALEKEPLLEGNLPATIPEGSVLPDTVHFSRGESRANVLARMQKAQAEVLQQLWATRQPNLPIATPQQALILASVVEKETGVNDERSLVAGVFVNRLRMGMKLQSDPTVVYGIEAAQGGTPMGRSLTHNDLQRDTPHNTYTREGLPPTPICNPGRAALEAVLNPTATEALYFVATGNGGHRFATTLKEHEANINAYRAALREAARAPSSAATKPN